MRVRATKSLTTLAVLVLGCVLVPSAFTDGPESHRGQDVIKACVDRRSGEPRIVAPGRPCRDNETAVIWNVEGPAGHQGPAGAVGATGPAGAPGAAGQDGRDGRDGRDGQNGGGTPAAASPIGTLSIEGIHGPDESSPILSVSGGLTSMSGVDTGGGGGVGKVNFQDIHVLKPVDQFSPKQYMFGALGRNLRAVDINVFRQGTQDVELSYRLEECTISSIQQSGGGNQTPVESLSFNFAKIQVTFTPLSGPPVSFCYDVRQNKIC
jgi:type VI secretion system secreted protein Hcp